ncbi:MAG: HAD family hydrolase, partial [Candidatus Odinarchaeia archaeon]
VYQFFKGMNEKPFNGVLSTLKKLKEKGYTLAIVTGRITESNNVKEELSKYGIDELIDDIITNKKLNDNPKEAYLTKIYQIKHLLEKYDIPPKKSVVVGDYVADIASGKKLGCLTIAVLTGGIDYSILKKEKPDLILQSVAEIPKILGI